MSIRQAALSTSRVIDAIGRLPGVATQDWGDRAARAMASLHVPCVVGLMIGRVDPRGFIEKLCTSGAGASTPSDAGSASLYGAASPLAPPPLPPVPPLLLPSIRAGFSQGEWVGWNLGSVREQSAMVTTASSQGLLVGRGDAPLARRWASLAPTEIVLGAVSVPHEGAGCTALVEVASGDPQFAASEVALAVLYACLPHLAARVSCSLGRVVEKRHQWLTSREEAVLWELTAGKKVPQIALELGRSVYTIHDHVKNIHRKLGAKSRGALIARALGHLVPTAATALDGALAPAGDAPDAEAENARDGQAR